MNSSAAYILFALVVMAVIAILFLLLKTVDEQRRLSLRASLSFALIIGGVLFGEERWLGYALTGLGILLAMVDLVFKRGYGH